MAEIVKPDKQPRWATTGTVTEPSEGKKDSGWLSAERPAFQFFNWLLLKAYSWTNYFEQRLDVTLGWNANTTLTIASGVVTPTRGGHLIDTEAAAATDDLTNIVTTNLDDGRLLLITLANAARNVVVKNAAGGAGQIFTADGYDATLDLATDRMLLRRNGADWYEVSRNFASAVHAFNQFQVYGSAGSFNFTVPQGVRYIRARMVAGGGGGGGGGEGNASGSGGAGGVAGAAGGDSWVINSGNNARGGKAGQPGGGGTASGHGAGGSAVAAYSTNFAVQNMQWGSKGTAAGTAGSGAGFGAGGAGAKGWPVLYDPAHTATSAGGATAGAVGQGANPYGGGGGGGAGNTGSGPANHGGGGSGGDNGEYREMILAVTPGSIISLQVGGGGSGGAGGTGNAGPDGGAGGNGAGGIVVIHY